MKNLILALVAGIAVGVALGRASAGGDPNDHPTYGESGLPKNCRAIVQVNVDAWRMRQYPPDEIFASLERNCGALGHSWGQ